MPLTDKKNSWLLKLLIAMILTLLTSWATWGTTTTIAHGSRIAVAEHRVADVERHITEIKETQLRMEQKLDRVLEGERNGGTSR